MSFHNAETGYSIHVSNAFTYADAAARTGATGLVVADNGKIALQSDTLDYYILTDYAGPTWKILTNTSGGGTVNSGTAGRLSLYDTSTDAVSDTYVQNTKNITLAIATQGTRSQNLALSIPNPGDAVTSSNVVLDVGNYTIDGLFTFSKPPTLPINSIAGTGTVTPDATTSSTFFTTVTGALTVDGPTGGVDGQKITFRILNDASHAVTFSTGAGNFRFGTDIPSYTNSISLTDYIGVIWNNVAGVWDIVSVIQGF